ncbi:MAG TPA: TlyA family RNA methyltransferase [Mycobacteriales bacterium]|nr:TlyA family RNA methyltransferase [Mycobacteriales bacterium]
MSGVRRGRLDAELVRRGLARSRGEAADLVASGRVLVGGVPASKAASAVRADEPVRVTEPPDGEQRWVSRGGHKLAHAIGVFGPQGLAVAGRRALDAGASTGGFTHVLLHHGAAHVVAVDVGYGQLAWSLQTDERVTVLDRTNVRHLEPAALDAPVSLVVGDLSFISLLTVLPALQGVATADADLVLLVKPQFEVGRDHLGRDGVVRDPALRRDAVRRVAYAASRLGLGTAGITASPLPGPAGNVEYVIWLRGDAGALTDGALDAAVAEGPQ